MTKPALGAQASARGGEESGRQIEGTDRQRGSA